MWFEKLTGFPEKNPANVRENISVSADQETITSKTNGRSMRCGLLEVLSLRELRDRINQMAPSEPVDQAKLKLSEVVANVQSLHLEDSNAGAMFQVASQFNLLEMVFPSVTPEMGVDIYDQDLTQGPACAIACGAGTIYRNYSAPVSGQTGQTENNQIDCIKQLGNALGNANAALWEMKNGYCLATKDGLAEITNRLTAADAAANENERDELRQLLEIGIQWDTEVTLKDSEAPHIVTQAYCSALPVAYSPIGETMWFEFANMVLEASYEAFFCAAVLNAKATGNNKVFLTLLGGGAFGNPVDWIFSAITRSLEKFQGFDLDISIVSYGRSSHHIRQFLADY